MYQLLVNAKFAWKIIFEEIDIAEQIDVCGRVDVVGQEQSMLEGHPIAALLAFLRRFTREGLVRLGVIGIVRNEVTIAAVVLSGI